MSIKDKDSYPIFQTGARLFGFWTVLLILTLNGDNGRDMLDVGVEYVQALTAQINNEITQ